MEKLKLQVIIGSTKPGRNGAAVGKWVAEIARKREDVEVELVDVAEYNLPLYDEPVSPAYGPHTKPHSQRWGAKIAEADAYVFVAAEYNHSVPGALKNAIDFLYHEWNNKSVGFVSYGSNGGSRSVEHLRGIAGEVQLADVREQVLLMLGDDFENMSVFKPREFHAAKASAMLDQVVAWGRALKTVRAK